MTTSPADPSLDPYHVWFDPTLPDLIAIKVSEMTDALREQLAQENIEVRSAHATSLHDAVRQAFPERFNQDEQRTLKAAFRVDAPTVRTVARRADTGLPRRSH